MNGPPRKQVLDQLDALKREIAEYHRWLAEYPVVCRVLENIMLRIERPLPGTDQTRYRSISNLREELRVISARELFGLSPEEARRSAAEYMNGRADVSGVKEDGNGR